MINFHNFLCIAALLSGKVLTKGLHNRAPIILPYYYKTVKRKILHKDSVAQLVYRTSSVARRMPGYEAYGGTPPTTKTDQNCRTCTDFKFWSKQQRQIFHKAGSKEGDKDHQPRRDCPLDKGQLGAAAWGLLHTIGAFYPEQPTAEEKKDIKTFFEVLARVYPCTHCAQDFQKDLSKNPVQVNSQQELTTWLCNFHNRVNVKLGKPKYDCSKYNQRWRDGWLDGSCD